MRVLPSVVTTVCTLDRFRHGSLFQKLSLSFLINNILFLQTRCLVEVEQCQYMGHVQKLWSGACSSVPHSQVALGDSLHWHMDRLNLPTLVRKPLRHVHANLGTSRPAGLC